MNSYRIRFPIEDPPSVRAPVRRRHSCEKSKKNSQKKPGASHGASTSDKRAFRSTAEGNTALAQAIGLWERSKQLATLRLHRTWRCRPSVQNEQDSVEITERRCSELIWTPPSQRLAPCRQESERRLHAAFEQIRTCLRASFRASDLICLFQ